MNGAKKRSETIGMGGIKNRVRVEASLIERNRRTGEVRIW